MWAPRSTVRACRVFLAAAFAFSPPTRTFAGGGPENVLLVVNPLSPSSLTIANHYVKLRQIPATNLVFVSWNPNTDQTEIDVFRKVILAPVLRAIAERHLDRQIDYIVYSSDFPWAISLDQDCHRFVEAMQRQAASAKTGTSDQKPGEKPLPLQWPKHLTLTGSLTGLTYLWQPVLIGHSGYFDLHSNNYMRPAIVPRGEEAAVGFRSAREYGPQGKVVSQGGRNYFLSTMLGVTSGRGNTLGEVLSYLRRSATADGTQPKGTIYFVQNGDIRSKVRQAGFPAAVRALKRLGIAAEILEGTVPLNRNDVQGVAMGIADFNWKASGSTILPGAICEHFTSFGGILRKGTAQTPLSEFLRYGAAGASGTVTEPFAIAEKFPSPMLQVHYARGCTLAEAFYQSISGPYQLLIVGDPLCRPWAVIPQVTVSGVKPNDLVRGRLELRPAGEKVDGLPEHQSVDHFELFVDGLRRATCLPGKTLELDTASLPDGHHELRIVAIGTPPIESQGRQIIPIRSANHGRKPATVRLVSQPPRADKPIVLAVGSPGSVGIVVFCGSRYVGRVAGDEGQITIPANTLGAGPVRLDVIGLGPGGSLTNVLAAPLDIVIE